MAWNRGRGYDDGIRVERQGSRGGYDDVTFGREIRHGSPPLQRLDPYDYGIVRGYSGPRHPREGYDRTLLGYNRGPAGYDSIYRGYENIQPARGRGWGTAGLFDHIRNAPIGRRLPGGRVGRGSGLGRSPEGITAPRYDRGW
jgi:hypothetical protein